MVVFQLESTVLHATVYQTVELDFLLIYSVCKHVTVLCSLSQWF